MPEPTINLQKDLELWVDFDTTYYDGQRNRVQDRSGHGRHPAASGGPTFGQQGPNSFEAVSFDGVDDFFNTNTRLGADEQSVFAIVKPAAADLDGNQHEILDGSGNSGYTLGFNNKRIGWALEDGTNSTVGVGRSVSSGKWYSVAGIWDLKRIKLFVNGVMSDKKPLTTHNQGTVDTIIGSNNVRSGSFINGEIATVARWHRVLSDAEIQALNNLTGPRRSQL